MSDASPKPLLHVVLVDDKPERGERIRKALQAAKHQVQVTHLERADPLQEGDTPELILYACDSLSNDYFAAIKLVKQKVPRSPLLVYTEKFREITRLRSLELGADDLVPEETLLKDIEAYLPVDDGGKSGLEGAAADTETADGKERMYFQLNSGELMNALQFLCMTSRVGQLVLTFDSEEKGSIFLNRNTVVHAEFGAATGTEALAKMLGQGQTEALFFDGNEPPAITNERPLSQILIEASVMSDEMKHPDLVEHA